MWVMFHSMYIILKIVYDFVIECFCLWIREFKNNQN